MIKCSYCTGSSAPLSLLLCCLNLSCSKCAHQHPCPSYDLLPLNVKLPTIRTCKRCGTNPILTKCTECRSFFCYECSKSLHRKGKYLNHQIVDIMSVNSNDLVCSRHDKKRNVVMENCSLGCIRCVEEDRTKRINLTEEGRDRIKEEVLRGVIDLKEQDTRHQKQTVGLKWESIEKSIESVFMKLRIEVEYRHQFLLERIKSLKEQQMDTVFQTMASLSVMKSSWESLHSLNIPIKDKVITAKQMLIEEQLKGIDRKIKVASAEYTLGKVEIDSLISVIKSLGFIEKVKEEPLITEQKRRSDIFESNRKDTRRSQSRDMGRSRVSVASSAVKTRENSVVKPAPLKEVPLSKMSESLVLQATKTRIKSEVIHLQDLEDLRKSDHFKSNFLQMKENIRKTSSYLNQRSTTRR